MVYPIDRQSLQMAEMLVESVIKSVGDVSFMVVCVDDWNRDLSPWEAPAVYGNESFAGGAEDTLRFILDNCPDGRRLCIGGYSLAGLFSLWAACHTDMFSGVAAVSPSVWFPGFSDRFRNASIHADSVYLSLGDRESSAKNPLLATVGDCIRDVHATLSDKKIPCILEWNEGNHFKDPGKRCERGFSWLLKNI
ncbi:MAG: esterase [Lachnospiraceae bacterium]|nr:esterase [Lachnospiraceae bacterium]